jgi:hypothetical protein
MNNPKTLLHADGILDNISACVKPFTDDAMYNVSEEECKKFAEAMYRLGHAIGTRCLERGISQPVIKCLSPRLDEDIHD